MNSSAVADLSGQAGPRGAIRAGLFCMSWLFVDRLHSVCQLCKLNQQLSNSKVIYTVWLQNIGFTRQPLCQERQMLISSFKDVGWEDERFCTGGRLPRVAAGRWLTSTSSLVKFNFVIQVTQVWWPCSVALCCCLSAADHSANQTLPLHVLPKGGAHELLVFHMHPVEIKL